MTLTPNFALASVGIYQFLTETDGATKRKKSPKGGFLEISKAVKAAFETLYGAAPGVDPGTYRLQVICFYYENQ